jgi:hypothetical protein
MRLSATIGALLCLFVFAGCTQPLASNVPDKKPDQENPPAIDPETEHGHGEIGPHQGELIELGLGDYLAELVHDAAGQTVTIYLFDSRADKVVPCDSQQVVINLKVGDKPEQFLLPAKPDAGDPAGKSSRFQLKDEKLTAALDKPSNQARINVNIKGRPYTGEIEQHVH